MNTVDVLLCCISPYPHCRELSSVPKIIPPVCKENQGSASGFRAHSVPPSHGCADCLLHKRPHAKLSLEMIQETRLPPQELRTKPSSHSASTGTAGPKGRMTPRDERHEFHLKLVPSSSFLSFDTYLTVLSTLSSNPKFQAVLLPQPPQ